MVLQPEFIYHTGSILILAGLCFLFFPGLGAFHIRGSWRRFRALLLKAASLPSLTYPLMRELRDKDGGGGADFHFFGRLQAMQRDTEIWLTNGTVTVLADLQKVYVHMLSFDTTPITESWEQYHEESHRRMRWKQVSSLPEYTKVFISGRLFWKDGHAVFLDTPESPLLVVIYEGDDRNLLIHATWSGRQKNEYWNAYTPGSVALGSFALFSYFYLLLRNLEFIFPVLLSVTLALLPIAVFLPPGIIFYFFYRRLWIRGRVLRAKRDLVRLSEVDEASKELFETAGGYPAECLGGDGNASAVSRLCEKKAFLFEGLAVLILGSGLAVTEMVLFVLFSYLIF